MTEDIALLLFKITDNIKMIDNYIQLATDKADIFNTDGIKNAIAENKDTRSKLVAIYINLMNLYPDEFVIAKILYAGQLVDI